MILDTYNSLSSFVKPFKQTGVSRPLAIEFENGLVYEERKIRNPQEKIHFGSEGGEL